MLNAMRNNRKFLSIVLWLVILAFLSTIFVVWGLGPNENQGNFAVKVDSNIIGYDEYRTFYDNSMQTYRNNLGPAFDEFQRNNNLDKMILDELINRRLFIDEAVRLGIIASDIEVAEMVRQVPAFQENGAFSLEQYQAILNANRLTPGKFEDGVREDILVQKIGRLITSTVYIVTDEEVTNEYNFRGAKKSVEYAYIPLAKFTPDNITDKDIEEYYSKNKDKYRTKAEIKLAYTVFDRNNFTPSEIVVTDGDIERYYAENISKYSTPESINVSHIIATVANWNDSKLVEEAKKRIDEAKIALKADGSNFADTAKRLSQDGSAVVGGLLGDLSKGQMVKEFDDVAFSMKAGEISDIVKTNFGFHIVRINSKKDAKTFSMAEKREEITQDIRDNSKVSSYRNSVIEKYRAILKAGNITAYNSMDNVTPIPVQTTDFIVEGSGNVPFANIIPSLENNLFLLSKTEVSQLIENDRYTYLFEITDKKPSTIPDLKVIYDTVKKDYTRSIEIKNARATLDNDIKKGLPIQEIAKNYNVAVSQQSGITRFSNSILADDEFQKTIFKTRDGANVNNIFFDRNNAIIAKVLLTSYPSKNNFEADRPAIEAYIRSIKSEEALKSYADNLRKSRKVVINEALENK